MAVEKGVGIFAGAFMKRFPLLPVEEDGRLNDPLLRENFIERIFVKKSLQTPPKELETARRRMKEAKKDMLSFLRQPHIAQ
jgi:hypothetical protein